MEKIGLALVLICSLLAMPIQGSSRSGWVQNVHEGKDNITKLRVFIQDVPSGPNATVWEVARASITTSSPPFFGETLVMDQLVTAEPDPRSQRLGRAQGIVAFADFQVPALSVYINFHFTVGKYNGSTITILGRNDITQNYHEYPIVGGSGVFRMARGYSIVNTTTPGLAQHNLHVYSYV